MKDKIEFIYDVLDEIAQAILRNRIPLSDKILDPNMEFEPVMWPDSYLRWKEQVKKHELLWKIKPLTDLQWTTMEMYLEAQYGLKL